MTTAILAFNETGGPDPRYDEAHFQLDGSSPLWYLDFGASSIEVAVYNARAPLLPTPVLGVPDEDEVGIIVSGISQAEGARRTYRVTVGVALPGSDMEALVATASEQQAEIEKVRQRQQGIYELLRFLPAGHDSNFDDDGRFVGLTHSYALTYYDHSEV